MVGLLQRFMLFFEHLQTDKTPQVKIEKQPHQQAEQHQYPPAVFHSRPLKVTSIVSSHCTKRHTGNNYNSDDASN